MSKLNAFLASVPANAGLPSPLPGKCDPRPAAAFPELALAVAAPLSPRSGPAQPSTPQPPQRRSQRRRKPLEAALASNQEEQPQREAAPVTPMKPRPPPARRAASGEPVDEAEGSEAGPMRRLSAQGSHHRRVSTDTTMFTRYLRQHAQREVTHEAVAFFGGVPLLTTTSAANPASSASDNNDSEERMALDPADVLAALTAGEGDAPRLSVANALEIVRRATNAMALEPNVLALRAPTTLVGDLHGQFQDLLELLRVHGLPSATNPFLFLGDYVDRGAASCEILLLLLAFKAALPDSVHLLRGNHECRSLSTFYGFRRECLRKYGRAVYNRVVKCFESMPLAARLETRRGSFLAVHGGLSPEIRRVEDINAAVNRFMEPEPTGALCDLLWADPAKDGAGQRDEWAPNSVRGCSFTFSERACRAFLERNDLLAIIRAHELEEEGFREHFGRSPASDDDRDGEDDAELDLPPVITVFSAPEYCNTNHNMGATLRVGWEARGPDAKRQLLEYCQHTRSRVAEREFHGASEDEAMLAFLAQHLPFVPTDFYDLVRLCRQLRLALQQSSHSLSLVSSRCNKEDDAGREDRRSERRSTSSMTPGEELAVTVGASIKVEGTTRSPTVAVPVAAAAPAPAPTKSKMRTLKRQSKTSSEHSDNGYVEHGERSGPASWRFCPGVLRVYERMFGGRAKSSSGGKATWLSTYGRRLLRRSVSTGSKREERHSVNNNASDGAAPDVPSAPLTAPPAMKMTRRMSMGDWPSAQSGGSVTQVAALAATLQSRPSMDSERDSVVNPASLFSEPQWQALKLLFTLLDVNGNGVLMEESFVVLLAEQDADAYATEEELGILLEVMDANGDGLITEHDFLLFAYRASLRWKRSSA